MTIHKYVTGGSINYTTSHQTYLNTLATYEKCSFEKIEGIHNI